MRVEAAAFGEEVKQESTAALPRAPVAASASLGLPIWATFMGHDFMDACDFKYR